MNVPNALSFFRIALVPIYLFVFFSPLPYKNEVAFLIIILAGVTDVVDGYIARKYKRITQLGSMLDPLADKLMMIAVIWSFFVDQRISLWAALFFFLRDVGMIATTALFHFRGKKTVPANTFGKMTTVLFYVVFALIMFNSPYAEESLWIVILFSFITSAVYFTNIRLINRQI